MAVAVTTAAGADGGSGVVGSGEPSARVSKSEILRPRPLGCRISGEGGRGPARVKICRIAEVEVKVVQ
jgi:hypothetical protein